MLLMAAHGLASLSLRFTSHAYLARTPSTGLYCCVTNTEPQPTGPVCPTGAARTGFGPHRDWRQVECILQIRRGRHVNVHGEGQAI